MSIRTIIPADVGYRHQSNKLQQFTKLCKGDMSQNSKTAKMVLWRYYPKDIIFHGGRVIVSFVPKFVAMATGVGRGEI